MNHETFMVSKMILEQLQYILLISFYDTNREVDIPCIHCQNPMRAQLCFFDNVELLPTTTRKTKNHAKVSWRLNITGNMFLAWVSRAKGEKSNHLRDTIKQY